MSDPFSFSQTWRAVVDLWPERVAIELPDSRRVITYSELPRIASGIAEQLATEGVRKGHLVGLRLADRRRFCAGLLGVWLADAVPVPLSATAPDDYVDAIKQRIGILSTIIDGDDDNVCIITEPK